MELFAEQIGRAVPTKADTEQRRWIYVPYDRLTDEAGPLSETPPEQAGIVMMEALAKAHRRPYHKKKLILILASQRQFALEQAARGVKVVYMFTPGIFADGLLDAQRQYGLPKLTMMEPAEREMRLDMEDALRRGVNLQQVPDTTWLSSVEDFEHVYGKTMPGAVSKHYLMDRFYRYMREKTNTLMRGGKPEGGQFSFDSENRKPYRGVPPVPKRTPYPPDAITQEAIEVVEREFPRHFGSAEGWDLPMRKADIEAEWRWSLEHLLPMFGPFEDAMFLGEPDMFHSRMSAFINISRLLPARIVNDVVEAAGKALIPLASAEGFLRQLLGWREYMRHMHRVTDGYRNVAAPVEPPRREKARVKRGLSGRGEAAGPSTALRSAQDDTGFKADVRALLLDAPSALAPGEDAGARPSALGANLPLPAAYWGVPSGLNCLDTVVKQVMEEGWSHHINRLMVLSNFATLCGYSPRELTDWFWISYVDAYDWVVEPNVLGMATFGDGGITATKPYVSGAAYINKMSNYCGACRYNPKQTIGEGACPFTALYWSFLEKHEALLGRNPRLSMPYSTLRKKSAGERFALREVAESCVEELGKAVY